MAKSTKEQKSIPGFGTKNVAEECCTPTKSLKKKLCLGALALLIGRKMLEKSWDRERFGLQTKKMKEPFYYL